MSAACRCIAGQHRRDAADGTEQVLSVSQVHLHDRFFTDTGYGYDIAVMKLARPARLNRDVGLVCLPRQNHRVQTGKSCYMTGEQQSLLGECVRVRVCVCVCVCVCVWGGGGGGGRAAGPVTKYTLPLW